MGSIPPGTAIIKNTPSDRKHCQTPLGHTFVRFLLPPDVVLVGYLYGDVLRVLRGQFQLDRRRVQHFHVGQINGQVGRDLWPDLMIAQSDVA